jgi:hypothetical protein
MESSASFGYWQLSIIKIVIASWRRPERIWNPLTPAEGGGRS